MNKIIAIPLNSQVHYFVKHWNHKIISKSPLMLKWDQIKGFGLKKYEEMKEDEKSIFDWKRKVYKMSHNIMDRISADEWFLKEVSTSEPLVIEYHKELSKEKVQKRLEDLLIFREAHHHKMKVLSYCALPFSLAFGILPGPNLPFAYNIFRVYSKNFVSNIQGHTKALQGTINLKEIIDSGRVEYIMNVSFPKYEQFPTERDIPKFVDMQPHFNIDINRAILQEKKKINKSL